MQAGTQTAICTKSRHHLSLRSVYHSTIYGLSISVNMGFRCVVRFPNSTMISGKTRTNPGSWRHWCKDKEHKEDTSSSKGNQKHHVMAVGTFNARREDPIARLKLSMQAPHKMPVRLEAHCLLGSSPISTVLLPELQ